MNWFVFFRLPAERDVEHSRRYHERQRAGLGDRFEERVAEVINRLERNPFLYAADPLNVRHAPTKKFKYIVHYRILTNSVVIAVLHAKRRSSIWMDRVKP